MCSGRARDAYNFNVVFRDDPETQVVAFTAMSGPAELAGSRYPEAIPDPSEADNHPPYPPRRQRHLCLQ